MNLLTTDRVIAQQREQQIRCGVGLFHNPTGLQDIANVLHCLITGKRCDKGARMRDLHEIFTDDLTANPQIGIICQQPIKCSFHRWMLREYSVLGAQDDVGITEHLSGHRRRTSPHGGLRAPHEAVRS